MNKILEPNLHPSKANLLRKKARKMASGLTREYQNSIEGMLRE